MWCLWQGKLVKYPTRDNLCVACHVFHIIDKENSELNNKLVVNVNFINLLCLE